VQHVTGARWCETAGGSALHRAPASRREEGNYRERRKFSKSYLASSLSALKLSITWVASDGPNRLHAVGRAPIVEEEDALIDRVMGQEAHGHYTRQQRPCPCHEGRHAEAQQASFAAVHPCGQGIPASPLPQ
jgi:hypothetical protein